MDDAQDEERPAAFKRPADPLDRPAGKFFYLYIMVVAVVFMCVDINVAVYMHMRVRVIGCTLSLCTQLWRCCV